MKEFDPITGFYPCYQRFKFGMESASNGYRIERKTNLTFGCPGGL